MSANTRENLLNVVSAGAAITGAGAAVTGAVAASGVALSVAAVAGGVMVAANVANKLMASESPSNVPRSQTPKAAPKVY